MSIQFKDKKSLNVAGMNMVPIKTNDDKQVFAKTGKCFSFGVKKLRDVVSMSLVLDDETVQTLKNIVEQCENHLGRSLTKKLFYGDGGNTIYPKLKRYVKFYESDFGEIDVFKYEDKICDVKAVLEVGGILLNGDHVSLQVKVYEALVQEHVREHVRLVDMTW